MHCADDEYFSMWLAKFYFLANKFLECSVTDISPQTDLFFRELAPYLTRAILNMLPEGLWQVSGVFFDSIEADEL